MSLMRPVAIILAFLLIPAPFALPQTLQEIRRIPLPNVTGRIDHMAADPTADRLFIAALGNNTIEVLDLHTATRITTLTGMRKPTGVRFATPTARLIAASGDDGQVRVYDHDLKLLTTLKDLDDADNVRLSPDSRTAYVGYGEGALASIDIATMKLLSHAKLDAHPEAFCVTDTQIFVNVPGAQEVQVIDRTKMTVTATWKLEKARANFPMSLDEGHHRLFLGCRTPPQILTLDTTTGQITSTTPCPKDTDDLFYHPPTKHLYLSTGDGHLTAIDYSNPSSPKTTSTLPTRDGARTSLLVSDHLYVACPARNNHPAEIREYRITPPSNAP